MYDAYNLQGRGYRQKVFSFAQFSFPAVSMAPVPLLKFSFLKLRWISDIASQLTPHELWNLGRFERNISVTHLVVHTSVGHAFQSHFPLGQYPLDTIAHPNCSRHSQDTSFPTT